MYGGEDEALVDEEDRDEEFYDNYCKERWTRLPKTAIDFIRL